MARRRASDTAPAAPAEQRKPRAYASLQGAGRALSVLEAVAHKPEAIPKTTPEFHFPLHTGSKGHVLLAPSEPEVLEALLERPLVALTDRSITDPGELRARLDDVRAQGYAITREDVQR